MQKFHENQGLAVMSPSSEGPAEPRVLGAHHQSAGSSGAAGLAQRRAGKLLPRPDQPDIRRLASSTRLRNARQDAGLCGIPGYGTQQRHVAEFSAGDAGSLDLACPGAIRASISAIAGPASIAAGTRDFELGDRPLVGIGPAEHALAVAGVSP